MSDGEALDAWLGTSAGPAPAAGAPASFALYARVSTEDMQDPRASLAWQRSRAEATIRPAGGTVVATYFDEGVSRSIPWRRRAQARRLLDDALDPSSRTWAAVVCGEAKRVFSGSQIEDVAPVLSEAMVPLWLPEVGGPYDPRSTSHVALLGIEGIMGRAERQTVQGRVRDAMGALVERADGRHMGGRPPYGYLLVDAGPSPNPRRAAEGHRLRRLGPDPEAAPVVAAIFALYLDGLSLREVAHRLNAEGVACPSAHDPARNPHRRRDGWQVSTVAAVLGNVAYTGYSVWGVARKTERLVDPTAPSHGYLTRQVRGTDRPPVRSERPTHPALVPVETFLAAQARRRYRSAGGPRRQGQLGKARLQAAAVPLRGRVRCACGRRMEVDQRARGARLRCRSRSAVPGAPAPHAGTPTVAAGQVERELHRWLGRLFDPQHLEATLAALLDAEAGVDSDRREELDRRLRQARAARERLLDAIEAGVDPATLAPRITAASAQIEAAEGEWRRAERAALDVRDLRVVLADLGDLVEQVFGRADPAALTSLYDALGLAVKVDLDAGTATATVEPGVGGSVGVRGGT